MSSNNKSENKIIYILIKDNGDGSCSNKFVEDKRVIDILKQAYENSMIGCEMPGVDGDGFDFTKIYVPSNWSENDLGVIFYTLEDLKEDVEDSYNDKLIQLYQEIVK